MTVHPLMTALRRERERCGLTQSALADRIGWAQRTVAAAEIGATSPTLVFVEDYAAALGVDVALVRRISRQVVEIPPRLASRRRCPGCGVDYQVTRRGAIRKHACAGARGEWTG